MVFAPEVTRNIAYFKVQPHTFYVMVLASNWEFIFFFMPFESMFVEELLTSELFTIPQSEEQFFPIRLEGESSQKYFPNQEADQDQVDLYAANGETNQGISTSLDYQLWLIMFANVC